MRRSRRAIISLVAAVVASTVVTGVHTPQPADALTSTVWLNRPLSGQRLAGVAMSADG